MVYASFTRKTLVNQLNIGGVCRCHASINLFWLRKCFVLFVTKQYQSFCKDRRWGPGEAPVFWSPI